MASGPVGIGFGMSPGGDVGSTSESGLTRTFQYDFLDRLIQSPGWPAYGYDGNGSRTSETMDSASSTYAVVKDGSRG